MASPLEDLDELTLRCRDHRAREYISEAVAAYRAGAFRSAIVASWIAVCFDVIGKLRELSLAGDKAAEVYVDQVDEIRRKDDLSGALKFERELLQLAKDKFELLSPIEYVDLERLQADRNRCAHPSLTSDGLAYRPPAELARLHIHSAVTHLLQHPPVQGKYALERILSEIDSPYFPTTKTEARIAFAPGPLSRPRASLIRNLVVVLLKAMLLEARNYTRRKQLIAALGALQEMHPIECSTTLGSSLSEICRRASDDKLQYQIELLEDDPGCWEYMDEDLHQKLVAVVDQLPSSEIETIPFLLRFAPLARSAMARLRRITIKELESSLFFDFPPQIGDVIVGNYLRAGSFESANNWGKHIAFYASEISADQVRLLITGAAANSQIQGSHQFRPLLQKLREAGKLDAGQFDQQLVDADLSEFVNI